MRRPPLPAPSQPWLWHLCLFGPVTLCHRDLSFPRPARPAAGGRSAGGLRSRRHHQRLAARAGILEQPLGGREWLAETKTGVNPRSSALLQKCHLFVNNGNSSLTAPRYPDGAFPWRRLWPTHLSSLSGQSGYRHQIAAGSLATLILAVAIVTLPYGRVALPANPSFLPAFGAMTFVSDLLTGCLLLSQARAGERARAVAARGRLPLFRHDDHPAFPGVPRRGCSLPDHRRQRQRGLVMGNLAWRLQRAGAGIRTWPASPAPSARRRLRIDRFCPWRS